MKTLKKLTALVLTAILSTSVLTVYVSAAPSDEGRPSETQTYETGLSSINYDFDAEYFYSDYNAQSQAAEGIDTFENKDIVFQTVYYDELNYILNSEGYYLILFGGSWDAHTRAAIPYINEFAKAYGIDTIYNFDFRLDGSSEETNILENDIDVSPAADYNYLYGELVERYLTNLNDWVEYTDGSENAVTWRNVDDEYVAAAQLQTPFLFLYNKDNTVDNSPGTAGAADKNTGKTYPIVYGFEELVYRDEDGLYVVEQTDNATEYVYVTSQYKTDLKEIFNYIFKNQINIETYTDAEYFHDVFVTGNGRGHSEKLYDIFEEGEQINLKAITYRELTWLLEQDGSALIAFAGAWCANSTAAAGLINDYAVQNDVIVYWFDTRLDGKYPIDFWGYGRERQFKISETTLHNSTEPNPFAHYYVDLINTYLPNIEVLEGEMSYVDSDGNTVTSLKTQHPYLFAYSKNATDENGERAPALAWHEQMLEVTANSLKNGSYIYTEENYAEYTAGIYKVLTAYAERTGIEVQEYFGAPRNPLINLDLVI